MLIERDGSDFTDYHLGGAAYLTEPFAKFFSIGDGGGK